VICLKLHLLRLNSDGTVARGTRSVSKTEASRPVSEKTRATPPEAFAINDVRPHGWVASRRKIPRSDLPYLNQGGQQFRRTAEVKGDPGWPSSFRRPPQMRPASSQDLAIIRPTDKQLSSTNLVTPKSLQLVTTKCFNLVAGVT
jgi:hypothetical protein